MNSVSGGWRVAETRKPSATGGHLGPGGSKTLTWWSTEPVVRCRIVEIGPFQRRQPNLVRPESAFPQVGKKRVLSWSELTRALFLLTTNTGLPLFAENRAVGLLVLLGVDVENDVHVGLGVGVEPGPHRVDGDARCFFLREPERAGGDAAEGD